MDIVERLRQAETAKDFFEDWKVYKEAADEIERLRKDYALAWENHLLHEQIFVLTEAKIERLREALQKIAKTADWPTQLTIAKSALQQKESK